MTNGNMVSWQKMDKGKIVAYPAISHPTKQSFNQPFQRAESESIRKQLRTVGILGRMRTDNIIDIQIPPFIFGYSPPYALNIWYFAVRRQGVNMFDMHHCIYNMSN